MFEQGMGYGATIHNGNQRQHDRLRNTTTRLRLISRSGHCKTVWLECVIWYIELLSSTNYEATAICSISNLVPKNVDFSRTDSIVSQFSTGPLMTIGPFWCSTTSVSSFQSVKMDMKNVKERFERAWIIQKQWDFVLWQRIAVMVWQCISIHGVGNLVVTECILTFLKLLFLSQ